MKLVTELFTFDASVARAAICPAEGLDDSPLTAAVSESSEDLIAWVSLAKSLLAWLTSLVALLSIFLSCASNPLRLLMELALRPLIEFWRSVRAEQ